MNKATKDREQLAANQRENTERELALDRQRESLLETYFDRMTELISKENLITSPSESPARTIARARTLTTLDRLDGKRKGQVIVFLYESGMIGKNPVISLTGADLTEITFFTKPILAVAGRQTGLGVNLAGVNLSGTILNKANLSMADLRDANLSDTELRETHMSCTKLKHANLRGAQGYNTNLMGSDLRWADLGCSQRLLDADDLANRVAGGIDSRETLMLDADMSWARLNGVDMSSARIIGRDLSKADLSGATLSEHTVPSAKSLKGATMPDGLKYEDWLKRQETKVTNEKKAKSV